VLVKTSLPAEIATLCQQLLAGLESILGDRLYGLYLYGAAAFPDGGPLGDVDFHAVLREPPSTETKSALHDLHASLAREYPSLGAELDGYYILQKDACGKAPPRHQLVSNVYDQSWALHRAHMRAGRCFVLKGPQPLDLFPVASWPELTTALEGELDYVKAHLDLYPAYCVLNLCRLIYSFETRDVVISKHASASWATEAFPQWSPLIKAAGRFYERLDTLDDQKLLESRVNSFFVFACDRIQESKENDQADYPV
jgi:hypothetical protein